MLKCRYAKNNRRIQTKRTVPDVWGGDQRGNNMKSIWKVILITLMILVAAVMIFFSFEENQKDFVRYLDNLRPREFQFVEVDYLPSNGKELVFLNGRVMYWDGERISVSDDTGKILWERTFLMEDPVVETSHNLISIYSRTSGDAMTFNHNGEMLSSISEDMELKWFKSSRQGSISHLYRDGSNILKTYDSGGNFIREFVFKDSFPVDYRMDSESLYVTLLKLDNNKIETGLVRMGNDEEPIFSVSGSILMDTISFGNDQIFVTDTGIFMSQGGEVVWKREYPLFKDMIVDGREIYIVYGDNLQVLDWEGNSIHKETLGIDFDSIHRHGKHMILSGEKDILAIKYLEHIASYGFNSRIKDIQSQFNNLVVTTENGINILRIEEKMAEMKEEEK